MSEQENLPATSTILDGRYRILSKKDSQDLGNTYWAYDMERDYRVSLLVLDQRWGSGREALERLQQAQRDLGALDAPGLVLVDEVGLIGDRIYLVRAPSQNSTLADLLAQRGRIEVSLAIWIAIRICEALAPAHRAGLIHGGLSPRSVLLAPSSGTGASAAPLVSLQDAGLLPALHAVSETKDKPWGRAPYLSPEQAAGAPVHPSADCYVVGSLLYEMLAGRPPFRSSDEAVLTLQHLHQEPPSLQILVPDLPPLLEQIVRKTIAKEPTARYRNAGQLAQILKTQVADKLPPPRPAEPPMSPAPASDEALRRLVVPPPPTPTMASPWASAGLYQLDEEEEWTEESASTGVDWMMVALFIAALLAVLGLIPLWRAVYRHYTPSPAIPLPGASYPFEWESPSESTAAHVAIQGIREQPELGTYSLVWYNPASGNCRLSRLRRRSGIGRFSCQGGAESLAFGSPAYGFPRQGVVHLTGYSVVEA
jgi:serine/threonine protein kinase